MVIRKHSVCENGPIHAKAIAARCGPIVQDRRQSGRPAIANPKGRADLFGSGRTCSDPAAWSVCEKCAAIRAAGDEIGVGETTARVFAASVAERPAVECQRRSAGRTQHRISGRGVPLHGPPEPGVDVGLAFGDEAEFQRGSDRHGLRFAETRDEGIRLRRAMRSAGDHHGAMRPAAHADRARRRHDAPGDLAHGGTARSPQ